MQNHTRRLRPCIHTWSCEEYSRVQPLLVCSQWDLLGVSGISAFPSPINYVFKKSKCFLGSHSEITVLWEENWSKCSLTLPSSVQLGLGSYRWTVALDARTEIIRSHVLLGTCIPLVANTCEGIPRQTDTHTPVNAYLFHFRMDSNHQCLYFSL